MSPPADRITAEHDAHRPVRRSASGLVAALALVQFTALMDRGLLAVLLTPIKTSLGLTDTQLGLLQGTGFALLYALAIVPAGLLADRTNRRRLLLCGMTVSSVGILGYALAPSFAWLFAASLMVGLGQSVLLPCVLSLIAERVATPRRARATAAFTSAGIAGRASALIGGGWLLGRLSGLADMPAEPWRAVVLTSLALNLMALMALVTVRDGGAAKGEALPSRRATLGQALAWLSAGWRTYLPLLLVMSATVLAIQGVAAWTPTLLYRRFALEPAMAALAAGMVTVLAGVAGHAVGGWATDRAMRVFQLRGGFGIAATALLLAFPGLLLFAEAPELPLSLAGLALFAGAMGAATPTGLTLLQSVTATPAKGTVSGLMLAATTLCGIGLGPLLIGLASDQGSIDGDALGAAVLGVVLPVLAMGIAAAVTGIRYGRSYRRSA